MAEKSRTTAVKEEYVDLADLEQLDLWLEDLTGMFDKAFDDSGNSSVLINRVPMYLKGLNRHAYEPWVVSLGLFHHKISHPLSEIELYKVNAVNRSLKRLPQNNQDARFLVDGLQPLVPKIKASYEGKEECDEKVLAWLFTLDGCFLLETLRLLSDESQWNHNGDSGWNLNGDSGWNLDPVFNRNRVQSCQFDIFTDLLMLENQVPIVVLIQLLEMEENLTEDTARTELLRMICDGIIALAHPFSYHLQPKTGETEAEHKEREAKLKEDLKLKYTDLKPYDHILSFFHDFIVYESKSIHEGKKIEDGRDVRVNLLHRRGQTTLHKRKKEYLMASATELYDNGMKFKSYEGVPSIRSLRFDKEKKTLFLPVIWISNATELIFRNLMAVDICQQKKLTIISEYVFLMNSLIQSEKDVVLLRKKGIIQSSVGTDKEASDMFNDLCRGVNFTFADEDEFSELKSAVNDWYKHQAMVRVRGFMDRNPKFMKAFAMFWGVVLILAAAAPSVVQIMKQLFPSK
ncbi:hypothetical protein SUGI_1092140 [Cryptomeria japonica]|nr:UPF0481 protein At3g47200 isoform X3 [Cryptomeria japonica]GLJ51367.1 hypothetical protein SUGI_1092140 [Cryptomeria japonica]